MDKMKRNDSNHIISGLIILAEILAGVACFLSLYLHLPAQRYMSVLSMGRKYLNEMKYDESVNMYRKAIRIEPKEENGYLGLGQAYTAKADSLAHAGNTKIADVTLAYDKAADAYQKVIDLDQNSTDGYYYQAEVYTKAGDAAKSTDADLADDYYQSALKVYKKVQDLDQNQAVSKEMARLVAAAGTDSIIADSETDLDAENSNDKLSITLVPHNQARGELFDSDTDYGKMLATYSEIYSTIRIDTDGFDALKDAVEHFNDTTKKNADQAYKTLSGEDGAQYSEDIDVLRADAKVLSFIDVVNQPGDLNSVSLQFWNFDSETGERVTLDKVVTDTSRLSSLIMDAIPYDTDIESLTESDIASDIEEDRLNWGIGYDGLHVLFKNQSIGFQPIEVILRFADYPKMFTDTFQSLPSSYGMPLENDQPYTLILASDGNAHLVEVMTEMSDDGSSVENVAIKFDETDTDIVTLYSVYQVQAYYLHTEDGRDFLYLSGLEDDDITSFWAVRLDDGVQILGTRTDSVDGDALSYDRMYLEDPSKFLMVHRMNLLGTHYVYRYCRVGEDGMPSAIDAMYDCRRDPLLSILRAKTDVPVQLLDAPGGSATGNGTVAAGTDLYFQKTDGRTSVDFMTSDGRIVRITSNTDSWPHMTNGIDEDELFYGIGYAG